MENNRKFARIKLRPISLSGFEKKLIKDYCKDMGYIFDEHPPQLDGMYPLIAKDEDRQRLGFIQRRNGHLKLVYQQKQTNLENNLKMHELAKASNVEKKTTLYRFLAGIIDFHFMDEYKTSK